MLIEKNIYPSEAFRGGGGRERRDPGGLGRTPGVSEMRNWKLPSSLVFQSDSFQFERYTSEAVSRRCGRSYTSFHRLVDAEEFAEEFFVAAHPMRTIAGRMSLMERGAWSCRRVPAIFVRGASSSFESCLRKETMIKWGGGYWIFTRELSRPAIDNFAVWPWRRLTFNCSRGAWRTPQSFSVCVLFPPPPPPPPPPSPSHSPSPPSSSPPRRRSHPLADNTSENRAGYFPAFANPLVIN